MAIRISIFDIRQFPSCDNIDEHSNYLALSVDQNRILKFHLRNDRCRALASDLLIRKACKNRIALFRRTDDSGLPIKPCHPDFLFNVSHDEDFVILAESDCHSVGIDIMRVKQSNPNIALTEMLENLRNIFTCNEWEYIHSDSNGKLRRFFHVWTAKEAYVKAIGTGLYTEPESVFVEGLSDMLHIDPHIVHQGNEVKSKMFTSKILNKLIEDYVISVCTGPLIECDNSWTKFCTPRNFEPSCPVSISSFVKLSLEELVNYT